MLVMKNAMQHAKTNVEEQNGDREVRRREKKGATVIKSFSNPKKFSHGQDFPPLTDRR